MPRNLNCCRVCGYKYEEDYFPWGTDGKVATFDICFCCGVEFGYQDCLENSITKFRSAWMAKGCPWRDPKYKPEAWTWEKQKTQIE
ncbi:hypothetical protein EON83_05145 [bacterium]|nr:MAG: hypothetical protein EON83_05145 [bacterium]